MCLDIKVDLVKMLFIVPADKIRDVGELIRALLTAHEKRERVRVRMLASGIGKIMAMHTAIGDVSRRMTRESYRFIAKLTGVCPQTPRE